MKLGALMLQYVPHATGSRRRVLLTSGWERKKAQQTWAEEGKRASKNTRTAK